MIKVILFMLFKPDQLKYWQTLFVYGVYMNLQVWFVKARVIFCMDN